MGPIFTANIMTNVHGDLLIHGQNTSVRSDREKTVTIGHDDLTVVIIETDAEFFIDNTSEFKIDTSKLFMHEQINQNHNHQFNIGSMHNLE